MTLSGEQRQQTARSTADSLPGVSNGRPFTKNLDVYKVVDKVFLIVTDDPDELIITVKVEPDRPATYAGSIRASAAAATWTRSTGPASARAAGSEKH